MTTAEDLGIQGLDDVEALDVDGSVIFRARQAAQGRDVVVKILDAFQEPLIPRRFDLRRKALAKFAERSGVVPIYEVGTTPKGQQYLLMPHFTAGSLADRLAQGSMPWRQAVELFARTATVVAEAHDLGVVLGDLKPSSILLDDASSPSIAVYGMATRRFDDGRPSYAAPENQPGSPLTPTADVYSLCLSLAALIAGRHPGRGRPTYDFQAAYRSESPSWLVEVIDSGLSADPGDRQADARALSIALQNGLRTPTEQPTNEPADAPGLTLDLDGLLGDAEQGDIVLSGLGRSTKDDDDPADPFDFEALLELPIRPDDDPARPKIGVDELLDLDDVLGVAEVAATPVLEEPGTAEAGDDGAAASDGPADEGADTPAGNAPADRAAVAATPTADEDAEYDSTLVLNLTVEEEASPPAIDLRLDEADDDDRAGDATEADDDRTVSEGADDVETTAIIDLTGSDDNGGAEGPDGAGVTVGAAAGQAGEPAQAPHAPADGQSPGAPPPPGPPSSGPASPSAPTAEPTVAAAETSLFDQPRVPAAEPDEVVIVPPPGDDDATTVMDAPRTATNEAVLIDEDDTHLFGPGPGPSGGEQAPSMPLPGMGRVGAEGPATSIWDADPAPAEGTDAPGTSAPGVTRIGESETTLFPARRDVAAGQSGDPNHRISGGAGADADRILGGGLPPTGPGVPMGGIDRRLATPAETGTMRRILDAMGALWIDRRPGLSGLVAFLSFLAIAGVVLFLIVQDFQGPDTVASTEDDSPGTTQAVTSEDTIDNRVEPTSVAPVLPEPASTHVTSAGRGTARRLTTTVATTLPPSTTTAPATSEGASTTASEGAATPAEDEEGALPPLGPQATPEGPTDPEALIRNADVSQIGPTSARIAFDSPACVTVLFTYRAAGGGPTSQVSGGTRCSTEHTLLLGTVTAPLEPATAYTVVITASDGQDADRSVVSFTTGA
ncbi:MAG: hypothetical protein AAGA59_07105 [Actinomycetota bacterium]